MLWSARSFRLRCARIASFSERLIQCKAMELRTAIGPGSFTCRVWGWDGHTRQHKREALRCSIIIRRVKSHQSPDCSVSVHSLPLNTVCNENIGNAHVCRLTRPQRRFRRCRAPRGYLGPRASQSPPAAWMRMHPARRSPAWTPATTAGPTRQRWRCV